MFTGINHVCVVTSDLDRAIRVWADRYGVGPWRAYTYGPENMDIRLGGEPVEFGMRVGLCHLNAGTRVELIQPLDARSPYAESLAERGGADHVHHLRLDIEDHDVALGRLRDLGLDEVLEGSFQSGNPSVSSVATYLDTRDDLGFIVELAHMPPGYEIPEPDYIYPAP